MKGVEMARVIENTEAAARQPDLAGEARQVSRDQAIRQIERRRRYWISIAVSTTGMLVLTAIWAVTEYHNAGGWPTHGFSQSSGIHDEWNMWIVYPLIAWAFLTTAFGLGVYLRRPISERTIQREIERQARDSH
jgi:hypothetical protein